MGLRDFRSSSALVGVVKWESSVGTWDTLQILLKMLVGIRVLWVSTMVGSKIRKEDMRKKIKDNLKVKNTSATSVKKSTTTI